MVALRLQTADGETLEAELSIPESPRAGVVITHPHPQMGGDMYTPVPAGFYRAIEGSDIAALRFNFRSVGASSGVHDKGGAERLDVAAAVDHLRSAAPGVPIVLAGWSFGADVSLTMSGSEGDIAGWFLAAPPLSVVDPSEMAAARVEAPKVLAIGANDQFNPPAQAMETTSDWTNTTITTIDGADHFFGPHLSDLVARFLEFLETLDT